MPLFGYKLPFSSHIHNTQQRMDQELLVPAPDCVAEAESLQAAGRHAEAAERWACVIDRLEGARSRSWKGLRCHCRLRLAECLLAQEQWEEALAECNRLLADPGYCCRTCPCFFWQRRLADIPSFACHLYLVRGCAAGALYRHHNAVDSLQAGLQLLALRVDGSGVPQQEQQQLKSELQCKLDQTLACWAEAHASGTHGSSSGSRGACPSSTAQQASKRNGYARLSAGSTSSADTGSGIPAGGFCGCCFGGAGSSGGAALKRDPVALEEEGRRLAQQGRHRDAAHAFLLALEELEGGRWGVEGRVVQARCRQGLACCLLELRQLDACLPLCELVLASPHAVSETARCDALCTRGQVKLARGGHKEAIADLQAALALALPTQVGRVWNKLQEARFARPGYADTAHAADVREHERQRYWHDLGAAAPPLAPAALAAAAAVLVRISAVSAASAAGTAA